jgi:hypothetical protein
MDFGRSFDKQLQATANLVQVARKISDRNSKNIASLKAFDRRLGRKLDRLIHHLQNWSGDGRYLR